MSQVINFDEQCRNKDTLRYAEIIHRRACARMTKAEHEHNSNINKMLETHKKFSNTMDKLNLGLIVIAVLIIAIYAVCHL
jgi:hypothetical protein